MLSAYVLVCVWLQKHKAAKGGIEAYCPVHGPNFSAARPTTGFKVCPYCSLGEIFGRGGDKGVAWRPVVRQIPWARHELIRQRTQRFLVTDDFWEYE